MRLTERHLAACMPHVPNVADWTAALGEAMDRFAITTRDRIAAFLAQVSVESDECRSLEESLNYTANRLLVVWPKRFTPGLAAAYANNPEKLANFVYAKRLGNGPVTSGDGWRYRGRGLLQITGRLNYRMAGAGLGLALEEHPEILTQPLPAALTAAQFWVSRGLNELADDRLDDDDEQDFERISILINGGRVGLAERRARWVRTKAALAA